MYTIHARTGIIYADTMHTNCSIQQCVPREVEYLVRYLTRGHERRYSRCWKNFEWRGGAVREGMYVTFPVPGIALSQKNQNVCPANRQYPPLPPPIGNRGVGNFWRKGLVQVSMPRRRAKSVRTYHFAKS